MSFVQICLAVHFYKNCCELAKCYELWWTAGLIELGQQQVLVCFVFVTLHKRNLKS